MVEKNGWQDLRKSTGLTASRWTVITGFLTTIPRITEIVCFNQQTSVMLPASDEHCQSDSLLHTADCCHAACIWWTVSAGYGSPDLTSVFDILTDTNWSQQPFSHLSALEAHIVGISVHRKTSWVLVESCTRCRDGLSFIQALVLQPH